MTLNDAAFWKNVSKKLNSKRDEFPLGDWENRKIHQAIISFVDAIEESLRLPNNEKGN